MTPSSAAPVSGYLTTRETAARIRSTPQHVRQLINAGRLAAINISKGGRPRFRVSVASVEQFLRDAAVTPIAKEVA